MTDPGPYKRHNFIQTLAFALAPGLFMLIAPYWLSALNGLGSTAVSSAYYLVEVVLLLAIIGFAAKRENASVIRVIGYNKRVSALAFLVLAAIGAGYAIYMRDYFTIPALNGFSMSVMNNMKDWPSIFRRLPDHNGVFENAGNAGVALSMIVGMLSVGAASAMQTLYFRGFLLSRIDHWGIAAPVVITLLFVIFHMGSPWFWPQFLLLTAIWAFIAYFTKNVWIVLVSHVAMNTYSYLLALGAMALGAEQ